MTFKEIHTMSANSSSIARVPLVDRTAAIGPVSTVLDQIHGAFGATPNMFRAVANRNACDYCLAAHTALGRKAGVSGDDLAAAQSGESADPRTAAVLRFALKLVNERGQVDAADVQALRDHGWSDEHIVEIVGHVALNLFTNYVNVALAVPVDFPGVKLRPAR